MNRIHNFESFLNEGSASMYRSVVQDALKLLGYNLKQSEFKVGVKKEKLYDLITLNGELLCSSTDYAQMLTWMQNAIKEDPEKYGLDPKVLESTNEAKDLAYWKDYEGGSNRIPGEEDWSMKVVKTSSELDELFDDIVNWWENEDSKLKLSGTKLAAELRDTAHEYLKKYKSINGRVIDAMISQTI